MGSIRLHPKFGVNPSLGVCFYCGKEDGTLVLLGMNKGKEAPRRAVYDSQPCAECRDIMRAGVILVSVRTGEENTTNPYRTGGWVGVTPEFIEKIVTDPEACASVLKHRFSFVDDETWDALKLPRGPVEGIPATIDEFRSRST